MSKLVVDRLELLAQALDVAVDGAVVDIDLIVVGRVHQGVAALHDAGALRQRLQDQELGHGQRHGLALPGAGVALRVHGELAALQRLGVGSRAGAAAGSFGAKRRSTALTRSTSRRCENGFRMKSSAPILRPNSSSISSSFEVRKMTGRSDFWRSRRSSSIPSMRGILMSKIARSGGDWRQAVERRGAVGVGLDAVAFGLEGDRDRGEDVAVVVDEGDGRHGVRSLCTRGHSPLQARYTARMARRASRGAHGAT